MQRYAHRTAKKLKSGHTYTSIQKDDYKELLLCINLKHFYQAQQTVRCVYYATVERYKVKRPS